MQFSQEKSPVFSTEDYATISKIEELKEYIEELKDYIRCLECILKSKES